MPDSFHQTCVCGRQFTDLGPFTRHKKGCSRGKKRLSGALAKAKEVYQRKRARGPSQAEDGHGLLTMASEPEPSGQSDLGGQTAVSQASYARLKFAAELP